LTTGEAGCPLVAIGQSTLPRYCLQRTIAAMHSKSSRLSKPSTAHIEELLDEALRQTFPASDPIAITIEQDVWIAEPSTAAEAE
jgi:hypothetical protein